MAYFGGSVTEKGWQENGFRGVLALVVLFTLLGSTSYLTYTFLEEKGLIASGTQKQAKSPATAPVTGKVWIAKERIETGQKLDATLFTSEMRPIQGIEHQIVSDIASVTGSNS